MKGTIEQNESADGVEIIIRCGVIDARLESLIRQIQLYGLTIAAKKDGRSSLFTPDLIFYFESVDERTYLYVKNGVYECQKRLYELEELLDNTAFVRISRACLLNTSMVESVRPLLGRRLEARLDNGERLIVNNSPKRYSALCKGHSLKYYEVVDSPFMKLYLSVRYLCLSYGDGQRGAGQGNFYQTPPLAVLSPPPAAERLRTGSIRPKS